jgi:hypothetical protein
MDRCGQKSDKQISGAGEPLTKTISNQGPGAAWRFSATQWR